MLKKEKLISVKKLTSLVNLFQSKVDEKIVLIDVELKRVQTREGLYSVDFSKNKVEKINWEKMSSNPHRILQVKGGNLAVGEKADITIIDPKVAWTVQASEFYSKGSNSAYLDEKLIGRAQYTINGGKVVFERK